NSVKAHKQSYLTDPMFPYWIVYRNDDFDRVAKAMDFNIFKAYRDRVITKSITKSEGEIRVLKSRNIGNNEIVNIENYDCYIDDVAKLDVAKFLNRQGCILVPNLTYNPRACLLPSNTIVDGSVAILTPATEEVSVTNSDIEFYATEEFSKFYAIARNMGTRSLNIDNNSVFFFGKLKTTTVNI
ncbi:MAG: restriction endonuclease, partial [Rikenellaceae bacterium]